MPTALFFQTNDMFDKEIFSESLCTSAFFFSSSTASVHLLHHSLIVSEPSMVFETDLWVYQGYEMELHPLNVMVLNTETQCLCPRH